MNASDFSSEFRHALTNLLAPLLTEAQLALAGPGSMDTETRRALQEIERLALEMRTVLKASRPSV